MLHTLYSALTDVLRSNYIELECDLIQCYSLRDGPTFWGAYSFPILLLYVQRITYLWNTIATFAQEKQNQEHFGDTVVNLSGHNNHSPVKQC